MTLVFIALVLLTHNKMVIQNCKHKHFLDIVHILLSLHHVLNNFKREMTFTVVCTINRIPTLVTSNQIPYRCLYDKTPYCNTFRVFRSAYFVFLQPHEQLKLEYCSRLFCFLGYGIEHKGYRC